jgi:prepilin-type N-terminal cleavage/methylation domain-containing protein
MTNRRGLSLVELLIAMTVAGIVGASLVALLLSQGRWSERATAERDSRAAARGPVSILAAELRMVDPSWGVEAATNQSVTIRIPYAMGIMCAPSGSNYIVQLLPNDAALMAQPGHSGYAIRNNGGLYTWYQESGKAASSAATSCTGTTPAVEILPGTTLVALAMPSSPPATPDPGMPVMLARRIRYSYANSGTTGLRMLYREVLDAGGTDAAAEEIGGPFTEASAARFTFFTRTSPTTAVATVPSPLSDILGLQVGLPGRAERNPRMATGTVSADLSTAFFFTNRAN